MPVYKLVHESRLFLCVCVCVVLNDVEIKFTLKYPSLIFPASSLALNALQHSVQRETPAWMCVCERVDVCCVRRGRLRGRRWDKGEGEEDPPLLSSHRPQVLFHQRAARPGGALVLAFPLLLLHLLLLLPQLKTGGHRVAGARREGG